MKTGSITVGLRETVTVCLMVNGREVRHYRNTELPDVVKEIEMDSFHFNIHMDGRVTFEICYEEGVLSEVFPETIVRGRTIQ